MVRAGRLVRVADGMYSLPIDGVSNYVPGQKAIVDVLGAGGSYTNAQLRARTGLTVAAIHAAVHHLVKQGKIIRIKRGSYARPGTAPPHIYARDAIMEALQSGSKTVPELVAATRKNRGEISQALHRLKAKGLIRRGRRGYSPRT
jgi:DNA-binding MarR family transcriptional regulator